MATEDYTSLVPYYTFAETLGRTRGAVGDESADATAQRCAEGIRRRSASSYLSLYQSGSDAQ